MSRHEGRFAFLSLIQSYVFESIGYFAQHRKLIDITDFASLDRYVNVWWRIGKDIIELVEVYNRSSKDFRYDWLKLCKQTKPKQLSFSKDVW